MDAPFTCALQVLSTGNERSQVRILGYGVVAEINRELVVNEVHTIYEAMVVGLEPLCLNVTDQTQIVKIDPIEDPMDFRVKELCAGMGGIGIGLSFLGGSVRAACDSNTYSCSHLQRNHAVPVVPGKVVDDKTLLHVQLSGGTCPCVYSVGFPCQPFSSQGDLRGLSDDRSGALWGALRCAYLHQARGCILECVPGVASYVELQTALDFFAGLMGWKRASCVFDLASQWPCKRSRWWCFMCQSQEELHLSPWPADWRHATVGHVIPDWPIWPEDEEIALKFSAEEVERYADPKFGRDLRRLLTTSVCPTILHSYAHGLTSCPCQCRGRFSEARLLAGGLRGFGVKSTRLDFDRHLHSQEAAFLLTIPAAVQFLPGRLELPILGQAAAPLQAVWVGHACFSALAVAAGHTLPKPALQYVDEYKLMLFRTRHSRWTWHDTLAMRHVDMRPWDAPRPDCNFLRQGKLKAMQLTKAEQIFCGRGETAHIYDGCRRLGPDELIQNRGYDGPYLLQHRTKKQYQAIELGIVAVQINLQTSSWTSLLHAGDFVFQALWEHDLPTNLKLFDSSCNEVAIDARLWVSCQLFSEPPATQGGLVGWGTGLSYVEGRLKGLSDVMIERAAGFLLQQACTPESTSEPFVCGVMEDVSVGGLISLFGSAPQHWMPSYGKHFFFCLSARFHWTLLELDLSPLGLRASHYDGFERTAPPFVVRQVLDVFASRFGLAVLEICLHTIMQQSRPDSCGTIALGHFAHRLGLLHQSEDCQIECLHVGLSILSQWLDTHDRPMRGLGFGPAGNEFEVAHQLATLLNEKGVAPADALDRAKQHSQDWFDKCCCCPEGAQSMASIERARFSTTA